MPSKLPPKHDDLDKGTVLTSGYSKYWVQCVLGQGLYGKVAKCLRMEDSKTVAIKMIKNRGRDLRIANQEVAVLKKIQLLDPNKCNLVEWYRSFIDKGHICLEFEYLDKTLHDFMKERNDIPLPLKKIRPIVQQIASALNHLKHASIMHTDLKLDNVMLVDQQREPFRVKIIDFGLACDVSAAKLCANVQSIPLKSPEVLLGLDFTEAIDMWALGCMAAALYLGYILFPGLNEYETMKYIVETLGQPPDTMLDQGFKTNMFFLRDFKDTFWKLKTTGEYCNVTGIGPKENRTFVLTSLDDLLHLGNFSGSFKDVNCNDRRMFVNMLKGMLQLEASMRLTPQQVLEHKFISMHHMARGYHHSPHVRSCFQMMEVCQKKIPPSDSQTVSGSLNKPPFRTTQSVQQNRPSHVEGPPFLTNPPPCTTTQTRGPHGSGVKTKMGNGVDPDNQGDREGEIAPNAYGDRYTWHASYNHYPSVYPSDKKKTFHGQYSRHYNRWDNVNQYKWWSKQSGYNHYPSICCSDKKKTGHGQYSCHYKEGVDEFWTNLSNSTTLPSLQVPKIRL